MEYTKAPEKITITERGSYCQCDNCFETTTEENNLLVVNYNETNYEDDMHLIRKKPYAKHRELWLCRKCANELLNALKEKLNETARTED